METSSLNSVVSSAVQNVRTTERSAAGRVERQRDENTAERVGGARRGGQLAKALEQTLSQFGINPPESKGAPAATASQANDAESAKAAANAQSPEQAVQGFMVALFQSLGGQGNRQAPPARDSNAESETQAAESVTGRGRKAYGDIEGRLQNLVQSLSDKAASNTDTQAATPATSDLESAFQNLSKALESSGNTGSSKMPDIQTFLKTLQQNIQNAGSRLDSAGNLVNTIA